MGIKEFANAFCNVYPSVEAVDQVIDIIDPPKGGDPIDATPKTMVDPNRSTRGQIDNQPDTPIQRFEAFLAERNPLDDIMPSIPGMPTDIPVVTPGGGGGSEADRDDAIPSRQMPTANFTYADYSIDQIPKQLENSCCAIIACVPVFRQSPRYIYYDMGMRRLYDDGQDVPGYGRGVKFSDLWLWLTKMGKRLYHIDVNYDYVDNHPVTNDEMNRGIFELIEGHPRTWHHARLAALGGCHQLFWALKNPGHVLCQGGSQVWDTAVSLTPNRPVDGIMRIF